MIFLIHRGLSTSRQANDVLVQAIVTKIVESPKFEEFITDTRPSSGPSAPSGG
ncbi:hypothetical protein AB0L47_37770 [Streptomyces bobili]|uniref:hypothetical protein n=1 Tax=Streptomyces bobili TaxID=67280 RepID=UPI0034458021